MDVELNRSLRTRCETLSVGSCFIYAKCIYIKVHDDVDSGYNTFNVDYNRLETVYKDTMVMPLDMKLVEK